ncbi:MAG: rubrerythrin [Deltaproteobacteria bacterium]|nr:rubrerythrin [Deltaproteobacteria bacterium]NIS76858.1 rubrerythrin [Deltaproteobacteria bacterium]
MELSEVVKAIHIAIGNEKGACKRYLKFAKNTKDEKGRVVLLNLAMDELGHLEKLEKQLHVMMEGKPWVLPVTEEAQRAVVETGEADVDLLNLDIDTLDDLKALEVALEYEILANKYYLRQAEKTEDEVLKKLFLSLAAEEEVHKKIIQAEIDSISDSGFWFDYQEFSVEME